MSMHELSLFSGAEGSTWSFLIWMWNALVYGKFSVSLSFLSDAPPIPTHGPACILLLYAPRERTSTWGHSRQLHTIVRSMADTLRRTLICWQALVIFILYLPPALLSLFSGARHWVLVQGFNREAADWAARATSQTHCVWLAIKCWALQASQSGSDTIKHKEEEGVVGVGGALQCSNAPTLHSHICLHWRTEGQIMFFIIQVEDCITWLKPKGSVHTNLNNL